MGLCENCKITMCRAERDDVIGCAEFVAKDTNVLTNADRIRSMRDEELADIMSMHTATGACNDWGIPHEKCGGNCRECIIDWLKQPAEVDNGQA